MAERKNGKIGRKEIKKKERKERKEIKTNKPKGVARGADPLAWCVMDSF